MPDRQPPLRALEDALVRSAQESVSDEDGADLISRTFEAARPKLIESTLASYRDSARAMLQGARANDAAFEVRAFGRWEIAFDHLETLWQIAQELGNENNLELADKAEAERDYKMIALSNMFPKALLITREIICLLKGGFPDGALGRWRSLHELTVTSMYIDKHSQEVALAYLASFDFAARNAVKQLDEYAVRANMTRFTTQEREAIEARCVEAESLLGRKVEANAKSEWPKIISKNFYELEKDVKMDHWRPRYKWSSTYLHAGYKPHGTLLGVSEAKGIGHLVGQSSNGFVDPLQMTAISLTQATTTYLLHKPNADRVIHAEVINHLCDNMLDLPRCGESLRDDDSSE